MGMKPLCYCLGVIRGGGEDRRMLAVAVARDLFKFIASFSGSSSQGNNIVVPGDTPFIY